MVSTSHPVVDETVDVPPSVDERRALIERVAGSALFSRSARLRDFLLYVGLQSLKEGCPEIHEQEIGAKVFGRSASYDRSQDNIVRVNATELRKRIELYFSTAGAHEPLILDIPRGAYKPVFHRRGLENPVHTPEQPTPELPMPHSDAPAQSDPARADPLRIKQEHTTQGGSRYFAQLWWASACLALAAAGLFLLQQNRSMQKELDPLSGNPALAAFWGDFLRYHQQTDIVLPDASLSIGEELTGQPISLPDYINRRYASQTESKLIGQDRREDLADIYSHNLVAFGDFNATRQILALRPVGSSLHLTLARFFLPESVKTDNLILVGGKKANPWVDLFDDQMNFSLEYDGAHRFGAITNRHPHPGEAELYSNSTDLKGFFGYSVVAYRPNPSRNGNVIMLTGTDSDATSAAAEFLTSEEQLEKFRNTLHVRRFPYFEVLLKTSRLSGTSFSAEVISYRTYPDLR